MRLPRWLAPGFAVATTVWALVVTGTPYVAGARVSESLLTRAAASAYILGSFVCHQRPERSFHLRGVRMPVCARCVGLYASAPVGAAGAVVFSAGMLAGRRRVLTSLRVRAVLAVMAVPTALTLATEWLGLAEPTSATRALTALPLGAAIGWVIGSALTGDVG